MHTTRTVRVIIEHARLCSPETVSTTLENQRTLICTGNATAQKASSVRTYASVPATPYFFTSAYDTSSEPNEGFGSTVAACEAAIF